MSVLVAGVANNSRVPIPAFAGLCAGFRAYYGQSIFRGILGCRMFEHQSLAPKIVAKEKPTLVAESSSHASDTLEYTGGHDTPQHNAPKYDAKQRRLMQIALALLVVALGLVLYRNRDFWF